MAAKSGGKSHGPAGRSFDTLKALVVAVTLALVIRAFIVEPFKIPSGSMIPTLLVGDYLVVNKFSLGVRLPFTGSRLVSMGLPERGDVLACGPILPA